MVTRYFWAKFEYHYVPLVNCLNVGCEQPITGMGGGYECVYTSHMTLGHDYEENAQLQHTHTHIQTIMLYPPSPQPTNAM